MGLDLLAGGLLEVVLVEGRFEPRGGNPVAIARPARHPAKLLLLEAPFEASQPALERFVERGRRGCETALQDLKRESEQKFPMFASRTLDDCKQLQLPLGCRVRSVIG